MLVGIKFYGGQCNVVLIGELVQMWEDRNGREGGGGGVREGRVRGRSWGITRYHF